MRKSFPSNTYKAPISKSILVFFILTFSFLFFVKTLSADNNFSGAKEIPETKKGTVIFKRKISQPSLRPQQRGKTELSELQKEARVYRSQGLQFQSIGNMDTTASLYQKAIELDPFYAVPYNDLGIIYEARGLFPEAEMSYLKCIEIDPNYLSAYSNLALLYENQHNIEKAAFYWRKRAQLGSPDDPWTQKARQRLEDILLVLRPRKICIESREREEEIIDLMKDTSTLKYSLKKNNKKLATYYLAGAKLSYKKGDELTAFTQAIDAQLLDPDNKEIQKFVERLQTRLLLSR